MPSRVAGLKLKLPRMLPEKVLSIDSDNGLFPFKKTLLPGTHAGETSAPMCHSIGRENIGGRESDCANIEPAHRQRIMASRLILFVDIDSMRCGIEGFNIKIVDVFFTGDFIEENHFPDI